MPNRISQPTTDTDSPTRNVFNNKLVENIALRKIPVDPAKLLAQGATDINSLVPPEYLTALKAAYNQSVTQVGPSLFTL